MAMLDRKEHEKFEHSQGLRRYVEGEGNSGRNGYRKTGGCDTCIESSGTSRFQEEHLGPPSTRVQSYQLRYCTEPSSSQSTQIWRVNDFQRKGLFYIACFMLIFLPNLWWVLFPGAYSHTLGSNLVDPAGGLVTSYPTLRWCSPYI